MQADIADRRLTVIVDHSRILSHSVDSCCVCVHIFMSEMEKCFISFYLYHGLSEYWILIGWQV